MPFGSHLFQILGFLVWGALMLVVGLVILAVVVLLVRFLWFGTKAAQLYIASHEPSTAAPISEPASDPIPEPTPTPTPAPAPAPDAPTSVTPDASGPVPKARKPKS
jgi:hypothetical protein